MFGQGSSRHKNLPVLQNKQMWILSIDYGRKKIGLAIADTKSGLAEPLKILRYQDIKILRKKIRKIVEDLRVEKIVVGVSEGKIGEEAKKFGEKLKKELGIPVVFQDETLTTHEAKELAIKAGIKRKKRRELEDAYAATLILQAYLDSK